VQANSPAKSTDSTTKPAMKNVTVAYAPITFADVPGWAADDHAAALETFRRSCERVLAGARDRPVTTASTTVIKAGPPPIRMALVSACETAARMNGKISKEAARAFFETNFTPNSLTHTGAQGMVTGYYEPLLEGSRTPQGKFQTPVYKRPPDLINL